MTLRRLRYVLPFLIASLISITLSAQPTLSGTVKDSSDHGIALATVRLFSDSSHQAIQTTTTDNEGRFHFSLPPSGHFTIKISHSGYREEVVNVKDAPSLTLVDIVLRPLSQALTGVVVTAHKPMVEQADDKIVFNAAADPSSKTETAIDMLRKTPFVSVDGDDNVQVNGQSNFKVLLNGKETAMFAQNVKQALKGFPGALIEKIEVITSPSSRYDAEGVGGIINIITKKKVVGYNGSVSTYYSSNRSYNGSANLNVKYGKLGVTGYYSLSGAGEQKGTSSLLTTPLVPTLYTRREVQGGRLSNYFYQFGNLELSWDLDTLHTVSVYGNTNGGGSHYNTNQTIRTDYPSGSETLGTFLQTSRYQFPSSSVGADYVQHFANKPEKEFSVRMLAQLSDNNGYNNSVQEDARVNRYVINNSMARNHEYTFQSDYILPFEGTRRLETGIKMILRRASSDYESLLKYDAAESYTADPTNTNLFTYHQQIYAGYLSYNFTWKTSNFRTGLRYEHTDINGDFVSSHSSVLQHYDNLVPNLMMTRKVSKNTTMVLNYNMRIQRPYIGNLNPFVSNNDTLNISYGNPGLRPQTIHNLSLQSRLMLGKTFMGITLGGTYSSDMIISYTSFNQAKGITSTTYANLGRDLQGYLSLNENTNLNQHWSWWANGTLRYDHIQNNTKSTEQHDGLSGNVFSGFSDKVTAKFTISGSGGFYKSMFTLQNSGAWYHFYQINFGYKFFKEKVSATINFNNFLMKDIAYRYTLENASFRSVSSTTSPFRAIYIGLTWNFGKLKENVSKKKGVTNDDLIGGGQNNQQ